MDPRGVDVDTVTSRSTKRDASGGWFPQLTIAAHPDLLRIGDVAVLPVLQDDGREAAVSRLAPDFARPGSSRGAPLGDAAVSRRPVVFRRRGDAIQIDASSSGSKVRLDGTAINHTRTVTDEELKGGLVLEIGNRVALVLGLPPGGAPRSVHDLGLVGASPAVMRLREQIHALASRPETVLVHGESGSGKELVARALHESGGRRGKPFVAVNLATLPTGLAAAELFGHAKGAYTGAGQARSGFFREADGGTLFLDEVGATGTDVQAQLLRALETGEIRPVGSDRNVAVDVRVVAATDEDLEEAVESGAFRAPLLHRLSAVEIRVPALRERKEDVPRLFLHFLGEHFGDPAAVPSIPASALVNLVRHAWPGNVRELRNLARQMAIASRPGETLSVEAPAYERLVTALLSESASPSPGPISRPTSRKTATERITPDLLKETLRAVRWNLVRAANRLGVPRATIYYLIDRTDGVRTARDLTDDEVRRAWDESGGDVEAMVDRLEVSDHGLRARLRLLGLAT